VAAVNRVSPKVPDKITISNPKIKAKKILKNNQATITIKEVTPAPYIPLYFKQELEQTKRSMFFE
jgi:hypothetical protein